MSIKFHRQIVRNLSTSGKNCAMRCFQIDDVHHPFESEFIEIQAIAHIIVGGNGFGVIVNHHRTPALTLHSEQRIHTTPVKFHGTTNAVSTRTNHHHRFAIVFISNIVCSAVVGHIQIVGLSRIFCRQGVDLLNHRLDSIFISQSTNFQVGFVTIPQILLQNSLGNLEIAESLLFCEFEQILWNILNMVERLQFSGSLIQIAEFVKEPLVDFGKFVNFIHIIAFAESALNHENTAVGRFFQSIFNVGNAHG